MTHIAVLPTDLWCSLDGGEDINESSSVHVSKVRQMQFLRLPHPRTGVPSLFLPHFAYPPTSESEATSSSSILEVQTIAPHLSRSWFLGADQVVSDGKLLLMTHIDPLFLLIPILQEAQPMDGTVGNFRPMDDIFEEAALRLSRGSTLKDKDVLQMASLDCVRDALKRMCDYKAITETLSVYRFSRSKLLRSITAKVTRLSQPAVFQGYPSLQRQLAKDGLLDDVYNNLRPDGRKRAACEVISQYLPPDLAKELLALYDFTALDAHIQALAEESIVPVPPRPDPILQENSNEKKRKAASQISKGVSKLMKANTTGMAKISSFFKKSVK